MAIDLLEEIGFVTSRLHRGFMRYVDRDDLHQEIALYAWGEGKREVARLIERDDGQRLRLLLYGAGRQYAEREKAYRSGYSFADIAWYTPETLRDLVPLALDPDFDGLTGDHDEPNVGGGKQSAGSESGTLLAMIADTRRALEACPAERHDLSSLDETSDEYTLALTQLAEYLGGPFPEAPGYRPRRRVVNNSTAASLVALNS